MREVILRIVKPSGRGHTSLHNAEGIASLCARTMLHLPQANFTNDRGVMMSESKLRTQSMDFAVSVMLLRDSRVAAVLIFFVTWFSRLFCIFAYIVTRAGKI